jgi:hypothetical protein
MRFAAKDILRIRTRAYERNISLAAGGEKCAKVI